MSKSKKIAPRKKVSLELLHHKLIHRYTKSLMDGDTARVWKENKLMIYPDTFCTSCKISPMKKKGRLKDPLKSKAPFKWVFINIIPGTAPIFLTSETNFSNYLLIVHSYSKIPKLHGMERITTEA